MVNLVDETVGATILSKGAKKTPLGTSTVFGLFYHINTSKCVLYEAHICVGKGTWLAVQHIEKPPCLCQMIHCCI